MAQVLSPGFLAQLKTVIRRVLREQRNTVDAGSRRNRQAYHQAFIATEITAATNAKTSPGTGTAAIWVHDEQTDNLVDSGETVNIGTTLWLIQNGMVDERKSETAHGMSYLTWKPK